MEILSRRAIYRETMAFMQELKRIKGNPNAVITMYRAAPTKELRDGDAYYSIKNRSTILCY